MGCDSSKLYHDGLCYQSCGDDYYGLATLCWQKYDPLEEYKMNDGNENYAKLILII